VVQAKPSEELDKAGRKRQVGAAAQWRCFVFVCMNHVWWTSGLSTSHFLQNTSQFSQLKELEEFEPSL
jgi:hypothetical protein